MIPSELLRSIADLVGDVDSAAIQSVGGGSINRSYRIPAQDGSVFFLKTNKVSALDMFEAERAGLFEIATAGAIRVPQVVAVAVAGDTAFLLMEFLDLRGSSGAAAGRLGSMLASQHRCTQSEFGWSRDNTIGSTKQINGWDPDWIEFFRDRRLRYQLDLARKNGFDSERGKRLLQRLPDFFVGHQPEPSLLHGDLWGGNWGVVAADEPVIFDPAVYYGDRESDIAMTRLFGGFGPEFYAAYNAAWPLDAGFERRCDLYNLYHVLNHLNLFGGGYLRQVSDMLERLISS